MGIYPFMFSAIQDFEPIVEKLIEVSVATPGKKEQGKPQESEKKSIS
jgi:hypothetical protein